MSAIRCVYDAQPNFPASDQHPDAVRYRVGAHWVDAVGGEPTLAQVEGKVLPERSLIERCAAGGGVIELPRGRIKLPASMLMADNLAIVGRGPETILEGPGPGQVVVAGVRNALERQFSLELRHLTLDGAGGYIGVDWRNVSNGRLRDVYVRNVQTGVLLAGECYYNLIEDGGIDAAVSGVEISGGANENTMRGGRVTSAQTAIWVRDANNNHFFGPALELIGTAYRLGAGAHATKIYGGRIEAAQLGVWLEAGSTETQVYGPYMSNVVQSRRLDAPASQYWWYGP